MKQLFRSIGALSLIPFLLYLVSAQDLKKVDYDVDWPPPSFHKAMRDSLRAKMGKDAIAIFYSAPERMRNADVEYRYRQDDNFYYLTGFREANAVLVLLPDGTSFRLDGDTAQVTTNEVLYLQPRNPMFERWTGRRYGPEGAVKLLGLRHAYSNLRLRNILDLVSAADPKLVFIPPIPPDLSRAQAALLKPVKALLDTLQKRDSTIQVKDPTPLVRKMRMVKSPEEIAMITKATEISALAHRQAMMSCEPDMYEFELQAVYEYVYAKMGAEYAAYPCIVGSGENSVVLHYDANRQQMKKGEIVVADCAAEYHYYASDITRTFPVSGKFSAEQKQIYQIVLDAQKAAIQMMKPGVSLTDVSDRATGIIEDGLIGLGIVKNKGSQEVRTFFNHGLSHGVGLNVHDVGDQNLQAGAVWTVEPGIYIAEGTQGVDKKFWNIGVRIEDTILITPDGNKNLSKDAPKEIKEIEALMTKKGIGNQPLK